MQKYLYKIKIDKLYGFINNKGEITIEPIYKSVTDFSDGVAKVTTVEGKSYIIDTNNDSILNLDSNVYVKFEHGLAQIREDNKVGFIDKAGNYVIKPIFDQVLRGFNKEGFAIVKKDKKYGTIDKNGDFIIEPKYRGIGLYSEGGMSARNSENKTGIIDKYGNIVIDFKYDVLSVFSDGLAYFGTMSRKSTN